MGSRAQDKIDVYLSCASKAFLMFGLNNRVAILNLFHLLDMVADLVVERAQGNTSTCTELRSNQFESLLTRAEDVRGLTSDAARQSGLTSESFKACGASNTLGSVWWERVGLEICFQKILIMYVYDTNCYSHVSVHHLTNWTLHRDVLCGSFGTFGSKTHFPENQQS